MSEVELLEAVLRKVEALTNEVSVLRSRLEDSDVSAEVLRLREENERYKARFAQSVCKAEAARLLCVSPQTVERLRLSGELPATFVSKTWRYKVKDLDAFQKRRSLRARR